MRKAVPLGNPRTHRGEEVVSAAERLSVLHGYEAHAIRHLRALAAGEHVVLDKHCGLCFELDQHAGGGRYDGHVVVYEYSKLWPESTGNGQNPIPDYFYHSDTGKLWVGEQLEKRLRLCTFIADQIELDMKEVQNESQQ